jgi:hypothetical protein
MDNARLSKGVLLDILSGCDELMDCETSFIDAANYGK